MQTLQMEARFITLIASALGIEAQLRNLWEYRFGAKWGEMFFFLGRQRS